MNRENKEYTSVNSDYLRELRRIFGITEVPRLAVPKNASSNESLKPFVSNAVDLTTENTMESFVAMRIAVQEMYSSLMQESKEPIGLTTGFRDLDMLVGGFRPGDFVLVGGRPGTPMTTFVLNILEYIAIDGKRTALVKSLGFTREGIAVQMTCSRSRIPQYRVRKNLFEEEELERFDKVSTELSRSNIYITDKGKQSFEELEAMALFLKQHNDLRILVVDTLDLFWTTGDHSYDHEYFRKLAFQFRDMARRLGIVVLCTKHLKSHGDSHLLPRLSDIKGSDDIAALADVVLLLHRRHDEYDPYDNEAVEVVIAKNRNGPVEFGISLKWCKEYFRLYDDREAEE